MQEKCHQYWPSLEAGRARYAYLVVEALNEYAMPQYILREFRVTDTRDGRLGGGSPGEVGGSRGQVGSSSSSGGGGGTTTRTVRQFQYTEWPEQGVPSGPRAAEGLLDFVGQVHKTREQFGVQGPVVVHCGAGVGRTGLWIGLSVLLERLRTEGAIDVWSAARLLRTQRPQLLQTEELYAFAYAALVDFLTAACLDPLDSLSTLELPIL